MAKYKAELKGNSLRLLGEQVLLSFLTVITLGLLVPVQMYYLVKFFIDNIEINDVSRSKAKSSA